VVSLAEEWQWIQEDFPASAACTAYAIMLRESGGNPNATNESSIERSYGPFQININVHNLTREQALDPRTNIRYAGSLYASQGWNPWRTQYEYDNGLAAASTVTPICGPGGGGGISIGSLSPKALILLAVVAVIVLDELG
jgi:hypothetical protein